MTGNDAQLAQQIAEKIDDALQMNFFQGVSATSLAGDSAVEGGAAEGGAAEGGAAHTIGELLALTNEFLGRAVSTDARAAARQIVSIATAITGEAPGIDPAAETRFRSALVNLREAISQAQEIQSANQFGDDPELMQEFLVESRDHLTSVEANILRLEREPDDAEALNAVFRSFHTIKGLSGFLGAAAIHELAHETENVLDLARSGKLRISPGITDLILRSADELTQCLLKAESCRLDEIGRCDAVLLERLAAIGRGEDLSAAEVSGADPVKAQVQEESPAVSWSVAESAPPVPLSQAPVSASESAWISASISASEQIQSEAALKPVPAPPQASDAALVKSEAAASKAATEGAGLRVDAGKLEYLIDMVGELVIAESVVRHDPGIGRAEDPVLSRNLAQLARVVQEVQKTSMSMRMVAVGALFRKMNRLVRDLSRKSGKLVELVTFGDDVELDRTIVEELADPMVHMIRNAVDHGLETPEERRKAGKPEQGTVRLEAKHDAGDIVIELADDGRGLDSARILAKARRNGLIGEQDHPDEDSIFRLIFEPGFSTVDKVTDLSGRGVGMDVVKKQIQKLRGRITIKSVLGAGCTFGLRLPLTLAIIDGLVVSVGSQRYILPMFAVREMFSPGPNTFVTLENRAEAALFRDQLLPVIRLSRLFGTEPSKGGIPKHEAGDPQGVEAGGVLIVAEGRDQLCCIAVDQLIGKQEVVIKSLGKTYRDVPAISGGAILGDGRVGLIIDVNALRYRR